MAADNGEKRRRLADEELHTLNEEQRRAIIEGVRGTLAADGLELTPAEEELLLAYARGEISDLDLIAPN